MSPFFEINWILNGRLTEAMIASLHSRTGYISFLRHKSLGQFWRPLTFMSAIEMCTSRHHGGLFDWISLLLKTIDITTKTLSSNWQQWSHQRYVSDNAPSKEPSSSDAYFIQGHPFCHHPLELFVQQFVASSPSALQHLRFTSSQLPPNPTIIYHPSFVLLFLPPWLSTFVLLLNISPLARRS